MSEVSVVIAGGGIGGLSCALFLHAVGVRDLLVLESVADVKELGVGINLQPHALGQFERIGLLDDVERAGNPCVAWSMYNDFGQLIWSELRGTAAGHEWPQVSINRGRLHGMLLEAVRSRFGSALRLGHRVVGYRHTGAHGVSIFVSTPGGQKQVNVDLLIGADGIHSTVRSQLYPDEPDPIYGGQILWRGITTAPPFLDGRTMIFAGTPQQKLIAYPITRPQADGRASLNWIAEVPASRMPHREDWNRPGRLEDFLPLYESWSFSWLDVPKLIREADAVYEFPMVDRDPLPRWNSGRVTLLGDAAHPMYPIGANGASQAIRDGSCLADAIAGEHSLDAALARYESDRRPLTSEIVLDNRRLGPEQALRLASERAPEGFADIHDVISPSELEAISSRYKTITWGPSAATTLDGSTAS